MVMVAEKDGITASHDMIAQHFSSEKGLLRGGRAEKRAEVRPADSVAGDSLYWIPLLVGRLKDQPDDLQHERAERILLTSDSLQLIRFSGHYLPFCGRRVVRMFSQTQTIMTSATSAASIFSIAGGDTAVVTAVAGTHQATLQIRQGILSSPLPSLPNPSWKWYIGRESIAIAHMFSAIPPSLHRCCSNRLRRRIIFSWNRRNC